MRRPAGGADKVGRTAQTAVTPEVGAPARESLLKCDDRFGRLVEFDPAAYRFHLDLMTHALEAELTFYRIVRGSTLGSGRR